MTNTHLAALLNLLSMELNFSDSPFQIKLSFEQLIEQLRQKKAEEQTSEVENQLLLELDFYPELREGIVNSQQAERCQDVLARLLKDLFPSALTLNEIKAINIPYTNLFLNHTKRFQNILKATGPDFDLNIRGFDDHQFYVMSCCLILNEFYGTRLTFGQPFFYDIPDENGNHKHYRILYNADYLKIIPTAASKKLTTADVELLLDNYNDLDLWKLMFPKESYTLKGFSIITLFDATIENAVSVYKEGFLGLNAIDFLVNTETILKTIYRTPNIKCGFMLYDENNAKLSRVNFRVEVRSFLLDGELAQNADDILPLDCYDTLFNKRQYFTLSDIPKSSNNLSKKFLSGYVKENAKSLIMAVVEKKGKILGILEIISTDQQVLNSISAQRLEIFMPYFSDSIDRLIVDNENQIQAIIQKAYTTIHDSVNWRFREEVVKSIQITDYKLEDIVFNDVYPLYGQIDIKGSSEVRNKSIQSDLLRHLSALQVLLKGMERDVPSFELKKFTALINQFKNELALSLNAAIEQQISTFLNLKMHPFLASVTTHRFSQHIAQYFRDSQKENGAFHVNRKKYENTISLINNSLASILDKRQVEAQNIIPHYYERYKTDGVDHNLYVGAAISPKNNFSFHHLYALRFWQLQTLCEMIKNHQYQQEKMPFNLDLTGLILVYPLPLTIRFRMEEKRFDVDGTYNVRFDIIKKRIDKAYIKNSNNRIVEDNKITIVYSSKEEAHEYLRYINRLQSDNLLESTIEEFDIEDLQSVSGLKGIRVSLSIS